MKSLNVFVTLKSFDSFIHQTFTELMPKIAQSAEEPEMKDIVSVLTQIMNI